MTREQLALATLDVKLDEVMKAIKLQEKKSDIKELSDDLPEWVTLNLAIKRKGGCALATYRQHPWLQPCGGVNFRRVGGRKAWRRQDVIEWLTISDDMLSEYVSRWGVKIKE